MEGRARDEPHVAVDAGTAVPTAVGLFGVIDLDQHLVRRVLMQIGCDVDGEGGIAVGVLSGLLAVDEDLSLLIDTLEVESDDFAVGRLEHLPVFALAAGIPAAASARGA